MSDGEQTLEQLLEGIMCELMTMNTLRAISMSHDSLELSSRERDFVDGIANMPFDGEEEE